MAILVAEAAAPRRGSFATSTAIRQQKQQQPPIEIIHRRRVPAPSAAQGGRSSGGCCCCSLHPAAPVASETSRPRISRPRAAATPTNGVRVPRRSAGQPQGKPLLRTAMLRSANERREQQASAMVAFLSYSAKWPPLVPPCLPLAPPSLWFPLSLAYLSGGSPCHSRV